MKRDTQRFAMRLQVLVGPAKDDVRRLAHARQHAAIRDDARRTLGREQRAVGRNAGDREQCDIGAGERACGIRRQGHARDAGLGPGKAVSPYFRSGGGRKPRDLLFATVARNDRNDEVFPVHDQMVTSEINCLRSRPAIPIVSAVRPLAR